MATDDGLLFYATITKTGEHSLVHCSKDRRALLAWVDAHLRPGDQFTIDTEASGAAALQMLAALRFGARDLP